MRLVKQLLNGFPNVNLTNPEGYMASLAAVFAEYPLWAGEEAVYQSLDAMRSGVDMGCGESASAQPPPAAISCSPPTREAAPN